MISGRVDENLQAWIPVDILDGRGAFRPIRAVLDTGFTGGLTLPAEAIRSLHMSFAGERPASLANGETVNLACWLGTVLWHGHRRSVLILQTDGYPQLGMSLLHGSRVSLEVSYEGDVAIEEIF